MPDPSAPITFADGIGKHDQGADANTWLINVASNVALAVSWRFITVTLTRKSIIGISGIGAGRGAKRSWPSARCCVTSVTMGRRRIR